MNEMINQNNAMGMNQSPFKEKMAAKQRRGRGRAEVAVVME